jgi:transposase InsO family protein
MDSAPKAPARKSWRLRMVQVYPRQTAHPEAGEFRLWSLRGRPDLSGRTVGRGMALHRRVYDGIASGPTRGGKPRPGPHPSKASPPPQDWCIDGRQLEGRVDGVQWWRLVSVEGDARPILAGAIAPTDATWAARRVLYTAWPRSGVPESLVSDRGGAYTADDLEAVCPRLQLWHEAIACTKGESYQHL